jgi:ADP-heptose:LPS heptosyltransferase
LVLTGSTAQALQLHDLRSIIEGQSPEIAARIRILHPSNLQEFVDLLAGAELVLSVDTAAAHAATALDRPSVILYSGQQYGTYGPWSRSARQRWIFPGFPSGGRPWHSLLPPDEVERSVMEVLKAG